MERLKIFDENGKEIDIPGYSITIMTSKGKIHVDLFERSNEPGMISVYGATRGIMIRPVADNAIRVGLQDR